MYMQAYGGMMNSAMHAHPHNPSGAVDAAGGKSKESDSSASTDAAHAAAGQHAYQQPPAWPYPYQAYSHYQSPYGAGYGAYGAFGGYGAYGAGAGAGMGMGGGGGGSTVQRIAIPSVCSGVVLGHGGSIIRSMVQQSGAKISLAPPDANAPNERVVTITGTEAQIQIAIGLIQKQVESFVPGEAPPPKP